MIFYYFLVGIPKSSAMVRPWDWGAAAAPPPVSIAICVAISGAPAVLAGFFFTSMVRFGFLNKALGSVTGAGVKLAMLDGAVCSKRLETSAAGIFVLFFRCAAAVLVAAFSASLFRGRPGDRLIFVISGLVTLSTYCPPKYSARPVAASSSRAPLNTSVTVTPWASTA